MSYVYLLRSAKDNGFYIGFSTDLKRRLAEHIRALHSPRNHAADTGDRRVSFDLVDFYHNQSRLIGVDSMKFTPHDVSVIADELRQGFEANILKLPAVDSVPFENAVEAYERVAGGTARAKQVLTFS